MRFAKEKTQELKEKIRFEMVKNPNVSILELQVILRDTYSHNFDKNFIGKLKRKVHRERTVRYDFASLNEEIAKLEDLIRYGRKQLINAVFNKESKLREITNAFKTIAWGEFTLLDAKLNAGVFSRPQQSVKAEPISPEQRESINRGLDMVHSLACSKCTDFHREHRGKEETN